MSGMRRVWLWVGIGILFLGSPASAVTIDWVTIGGAGNPADTTGYGSVAYEYRIAKYETTTTQYAEFLNAVAATDTHGLWDSGEGIFRQGSPGSFTYSVYSESVNKPVHRVTFYDSLRFANWLHNGQPTGPQGNGTTETGAYTLATEGGSFGFITRDPNATVFLTSEDEWYKAAYFVLAGFFSGYWNYPAGSSTQTTCASPGPTPNTAACTGFFENRLLADVGSYTGSPSPFGTFDQGGNVWEWTEGRQGATRIVRGGVYHDSPTWLAATQQGFFEPHDDAVFGIGFRVASVIPEPSTGLLLATGLLGLAANRRSRRSVTRVS